MATLRQQDIEAWLAQRIAHILGTHADEISLDDTFDSFGLASRDAVSLSGDLEDWLGRRLSPILLYQYPTIRELAVHLAPAASPSPVVDTDLPQDAPNELRLNIDEMSDAEAEALLLQKLAQMDE